MGTFNCPMQLSSLDGERTLELEALVDTGSFYTIVPAALLAELGVSRTRSVSLRFADGRTGRYDVGQARASVNGEDVITLVVFGDDDAVALLGAYTLEGLSLMPDPVSQALVPVRVHPV